MITGFVAAMMLLIECLNVMTGGQWVRWLERGRISPYVVAALLGAVPAAVQKGCGAADEGRPVLR